MSDALIIFAKNLLHGKVKTRLAATVGHNKAMDVYQQLLQHTIAVAGRLPVDKLLFYSHFVEAANNHHFKTFLQKEADLGERMNHAFATAFQQGYSKAVIIGTDVPGITPSIIQVAFEQLDNVDVVIGPATDGGYYLLGMKQNHAPLFQGIEWSTSSVFSTTVSHLKQLSLRYSELPVLSDVDREEDLHLLAFINNRNESS
jgi:rSAM/selenodomain-associated transferase 1